MSAAGYMPAGATRERLSATIAACATSAPHLAPVFQSVRDGGLHLLFVPQNAPAFRVPREADRKPRMVIVGDDFDESRGPDGFHLSSVRRLIRAGSLFSVVTAAPEASVYGSAALSAVVNRSLAVVIETRLQHEFQWVELIRKLAPGRMTWVHTVQGGRA